MIGCHGRLGLLPASFHVFLGARRSLRLWGGCSVAGARIANTGETARSIASCQCWVKGRIKAGRERLQVLRRVWYYPLGSVSVYGAHARVCVADLWSHVGLSCCVPFWLKRPMWSHGGAPLEVIMVGPLCSRGTPPLIRRIRTPSLRGGGLQAGSRGRSLLTARKCRNLVGCHVVLGFPHRSTGPAPGVGASHLGESTLGG